MLELIIKLEGTDKLAVVNGKPGRDISMQANKVIRGWVKEQFSATGEAVHILPIEKSTKVWIVKFN